MYLAITWQTLMSHSSVFVRITKEINLVYGVILARGCRIKIKKSEKKENVVRRFYVHNTMSDRSSSHSVRWLDPSSDLRMSYLFFLFHTLSLSPFLFLSSHFLSLYQAIEVRGGYIDRPRWRRPSPHDYNPASNHKELPCNLKLVEACHSAVIRSCRDLCLYLCPIFSWFFSFSLFCFIFIFFNLFF